MSCWYILSSCPTYASRPSSCSRPSSPKSRPSSPCSRPSSACTPCVPYYHCNPCYCTPCPAQCCIDEPCQSPSRRKQKLSDFAGGGIGPGPDVNDKNKFTNAKQRIKRRRKGGKNKNGDEVVGESEKKTTKGKNDDEGVKNGNKSDAKGDKAKNGNKSGARGDKTKNGNESSAKGDKTKETSQLTTDSAKTDGATSSINGEKNRKDNVGGTTDKAATDRFGKSSKDIGICTPRLPPCPCLNPVCPSNLRKMQSRLPYTCNNSNTYQQRKLKCYCKENKNAASCGRVKEPEAPIEKPPVERCSKCGKKKRPKKPKETEMSKDATKCGCGTFYVKNSKFTSHTCPPEEFPNVKLKKCPCKHIITLMTEDNQVLGYQNVKYNDRN